MRGSKDIGDAKGYGKSRQGSVAEKACEESRAKFAAEKAEQEALIAYQKAEAQKFLDARIEPGNANAKKGPGAFYGWSGD